MSEDTHDLLDDDSADRTQRLMDRMEGLIRHQEDLLDKVRRGWVSPYCHIPDLFDLDTEAERPYSVPSSFIPEQVGGNVSVKSTRGAYLDHEPLDLVLGSFLPGGYKRRYRFDMWTGNWDDASEPGFASIEPGVSIRRKASLAEVLPDTDHEEYTPYRHPTDAVTVYIPNQFVLQNPSVSDEVDFQNYYWDEQAGLVRNFLPEDADSVDEAAGYLPLASDPTSQFLWFKHLLHVRDRTDELALGDPEDGLFSTLTFSDDAIFLKNYYATLLTLYGEDRTFSEVIRYRHESDDQIAFMGSREESQLLLFNLDRERIGSLLEREVTPGSTLYRDMQFAMLYRRVWDQFFFRDEVLGHAFSVDPFYQALVGVDYMLRTGPEGPDSLFACEPDDIVESLETLLPGPNERLGLLDYDDYQLERYTKICREHSDGLAEILADCADQTEVTEFAEHVLVHSIKHGIATWAVEFSAGGSDFEAWYDINFQQHSDDIQLGIYDSIQGGAGISREVFEDLQTVSKREFIGGVGAQGSCHIGASEDIVIGLLAETDPMALYDAFHAENDEEYQTQVDSAFAALSNDYRYNTLDELRPMVRRRLRSILETPEVSRFYGEVADAYCDVEGELGRTPTTTDVVLAMEERSIFDTRVKRTYDRFANRRSQRRDISELAERIEEVTKQCVRACPDCLKRQSCTHQYRYQTEMLDRRLLTRAFSHLEEEA